jgi:hypothetical protein
MRQRLADPDRSDQHQRTDQLRAAQRHLESDGPTEGMAHDGNGAFNAYRGQQVCKCVRILCQTNRR